MQGIWLDSILQLGKTTLQSQVKMKYLECYFQADTLLFFGNYLKYLWLVLFYIKMLHYVMIISCIL